MLRQKQKLQIGLTCFFVMWLSIQFVVLGVSPRWGFVLPHEHITRGVVTTADWEEHALEHERGLETGSLFKARCDGARTTDASPITASIPNFQGSFSLLSALTATVQPFCIALPGLAELDVLPHADTFVVVEMFFPPPEPPPNFIPA